jgi:peptide/nickel transport system ATP-binding protein
MEQPVLSVQDLSVSFLNEGKENTAVRNAGFHINKGEIVAIVGESGSGKSVTALSILQLLPAAITRYNKGSILFQHNNQQTDLLHANAEELRSIRGNAISMIFQEPMTSLNPLMRCGEQVAEAMRLHLRLNKKKAKQKTLELFNKVKLPEPDITYNKYPHQLSGGQKQRVMIAMAMSCGPSLLIADEPTTALDVTIQKNIVELIRELQQQNNMAVIFISHDLGLVAEIANRVLVMYKGEIVEEGDLYDIYTKPKHPYTKALLACRPILHEKGKRLPAVNDFLEKDHVKYELRNTNYETSPAFVPSPDILLKAEQLNVWFPSRKNFFGKTLSYTKVVNDVSFHVYKGETLGLVGESGCGKTTLGRALLRLIEPVSGKIIFNNKELLSYKADELRQLRKEIQIVFQDPYSSLNPRRTIGDAIAEPLKVHGIYGNAKQRKDKVMALLEKVSLRAEHFNRYPHEFSGGERQRIVIARALALDPSFIVFDESVSALDVSVQAQVLNLLNDLKKEFGFTSVFISHDLSVVHYISNRILVMNKGRIEESGSADDIWNRPQQEYTKRLLAAIPKPKWQTIF